MTGLNKLHPFDEALTFSGNCDCLKGQTSAHYANKIGPYGGMTAAVMQKATFAHPDREGEPVALTVNFVAPIGEGDFEVLPRIVRTNRSTQHWWVELLKEGKVAATATAFYAKRRETWSSTEIKYPSAMAQQRGKRLSGKELSLWMHSYDIRMIKGGPSSWGVARGGAEESNSESFLWVRDEPNRAMDFLSLSAICDAFAPRHFILRNRIVPAGTVSMTNYYHVQETELAALGDQFVLGHARGNLSYNNYSDQMAEIWSADRKLLATSHQIAYFKE